MEKPIKVCWLFHKWSIWKDRSTYNTVHAIDQQPTKKFLVQEKSCIICNKKKIRRELIETI